MAFHSNYWSCTPFADWIRGTAKIKAGNADEWENWETTAKMKSNFRYWLAEEGLDHIQNFVTWPITKLHDIKYYINNRWVTHTHQLTAHARDIKPGDWCDVGNRFLPCLFNELVDFVEIEQAWHHCMWSDDAKTKFNVPWWRSGWLRWRTWRCPEAGMEYLKWASKLVVGEDMGVEPGSKGFGEPTWQAKSAKEIIELYNWWTVTYPNRPEPMEASGWSAYCDATRKENGDSILSMFREDKSPEMKKWSEESIDRLHEMETAYEKEDEEMMIRLIKVRNSLWT
jgi:hypothetical protein